MKNATHLFIYRSEKLDVVLYISVFVSDKP